jgi:SdrD B-like domain
MRTTAVPNGPRGWLCSVAIALIVATVLPAAAMAEPYWPNEQAMRETPPGAVRETFVYDPGEGNDISREAFVQAPLAGYYEGVGFDANFLTWAPKEKEKDLGTAEWSGCGAEPNPEPCPVGSLHYRAVNADVATGRITVLYWNGAFISTVCGNFNRGAGKGPTPTISGVKYEDLNGNGKRDPGEPGLSGWTIKLRYEGKEVASTTTASDGSYSFHLDADHLPIGAGSYQVEEVLKPGWVASQTPGTVNVPLGAGDTTYGGRDFGNYRPATIAGHKFDDSNVNGQRDLLESGLEDWTIALSNGEQALTNLEGAYSFSVRPGAYTVGEVAQTGWRQTDPGEEGTRTYTVISGQVVENADFGNVCLGGVSVSPIDDSTGEPVPMEVRLEEVSVPGILSNEPSLPRTATGTPTFTELLPGTYRIVAFLPAGIFTTDPDAVPIEGRFAIVKEFSVPECETTLVPLHLFTESTAGKVTGGMKIPLEMAVPGGFATSGFVFKTKLIESSGTLQPKGTLQYNDHVTGLDLHTKLIEAIHIEGELAVIWGQVLVEGSLQQFELRLTDAGQPGTADRFELTLANGYEAGQGETLSGGNIKIHT